MIINMSYDLVKPKNRTKVLQKLHIRKKSMQFIFFVTTFNIFFLYHFIHLLITFLVPYHHV